MRGPQDKTKKRAEAEHWEAIWTAKVQSARDADAKRLRGNEKLISELQKDHRFGSKLIDFDGNNQPIYDGESNRSLRGPELARTLEQLFALTGDPVFDDALRAVHAYAIDKGKISSAITGIWGDSRYSQLTQIHYLVHKKRKSIPESSRQVAAEVCIRAASFNEAWDSLARDFRAWKNAGYPNDPNDPLVGNLGYRVKITSVDGSAVSPSLIEAGGTDQASTLYWRRMYRDGAVAMSFIGEK